MRVLLEVGHQSYLLPNDNGLQTLVKALSCAVPCYDYTWDKKRPYDIKAEAEPLKISVKYLPAKTRIRFSQDLHGDDVADREPLRLVAPTTIIPPPPGQ